MDESDKRTSNASFTISNGAAASTVTVDMTSWQSPAEYPAGTVRSPWNLLGSADFESGALVTLSACADGPVVADAVRFEFMEQKDAPPVIPGELIYHETFNDLTEWTIEGGEGSACIGNGALHVLSTSDRFGVHAWFGPDLPDSIVVDYDMTVHGKAGFALVFFAAHGTGGADILTEMPLRDGRFSQYVENEDFRAYHLSVHRYGTTSWVNGANLNRNPGKQLVQRNPVDPCPPTEGDTTWRMRLIKMGPRIELHVDGRRILFWIDDGPGGWYGGGKFGFRQIYRSDISYDNFRVYRAVR